MNELREVIGDYEDFIWRVDNAITDLGIDRSDIAMMDHICYRSPRNRLYMGMLGKLKRNGATVLREYQHKDRLVATLEFPEPLEVPPGALAG